MDPLLLIPDQAIHIIQGSEQRKFFTLHTLCYQTGPLHLDIDFMQLLPI